MEILAVIVVFVCMMVDIVRWLAGKPSIHQNDIERVETIITKDRKIIEGVALSEIDNLEDVEFIESRHLGYMYADEYPPYNRLRAERERQRLGLGPFVDDEQWDESDYDDWDEDDDWDREEDFDW
jgi:hypothetical protein